VLTICVRDMPVPSDVAPVPLGFDAWFAKACARDPEQRFQTARELTDALREALGLDAKDATYDPPEIMVASGRTLQSTPPPSTEAQTIVHEPPVESSRRSRPRAQGDAPTLAAAPGELTVVDPGVPAPTDALFGTTQHEVMPEPKNGTALVMIVAVVALGAGLAGGLMFLRRPSHAGGLDTASLPAPAAPPVSASAEEEEVEKPAKKTKKHDAAETASAQAEASAEHPAAAAPTASATAAPAAAADAGVPDAGARVEHKTTSSEPSLLPTPSATASSDPDAPWQKPAWAIPDNEIKVHRGPDQQDDKIVIPPDQ
jgi:serine/threonine-protein kinase